MELSIAISEKTAEEQIFNLKVGGNVVLHFRLTLKNPIKAPCPQMRGCYLDQVFGTRPVFNEPSKIV